MSGKPRRIRNIQSYINHIDAHTWGGPMKMGTSPSVGNIKYYWHNYQTQCNQKANAVKKSYKNMVFLGINPARTPVPEAFTQSKQGFFQNYPGFEGISKYEANQMVGKMSSRLV